MSGYLQSENIHVQHGVLRQNICEADIDFLSKGGKKPVITILTTRDIVLL